jgi:hypothetical protein
MSGNPVFKTWIYYRSGSTGTELATCLPAGTRLDQIGQRVFLIEIRYDCVPPELRTFRFSLQ